MLHMPNHSPLPLSLTYEPCYPMIRMSKQLKH
jgi:hypothetical protein